VQVVKGVRKPNRTFMGTIYATLTRPQSQRQSQINLFFSMYLSMVSKSCSDLYRRRSLLPHLDKMF